MKPLIIGQAPSRRSVLGEPLSGRSGRRLAALCGLGRTSFLARFDRANLLSYWPGPSPSGGDRFPMAEAKAAAAAMAEVVAARDVVVLLGASVAGALGLRQLEPLKWSRFARDCAHVAVCPHPSGKSLWWNRPENVERAQSFWAELLRASPRP